MGSIGAEEILYVTSSGGVLRDALAIHAAWGRGGRWVASGGSEAKAKLAAADVLWVKAWESMRPLQRAWATAHAVASLRESRPRWVVSAGTGMAVPWLLAARMLGVPCLWIEAISYPGGPARIANVCSRLAEHVIVQRPEQMLVHRRSVLAGELCRLEGRPGAGGRGPRRSGAHDAMTLGRRVRAPELGIPPKEVPAGDPSADAQTVENGRIPERVPGRVRTVRPTAAVATLHQRLNALDSDLPDRGPAGRRPLRRLSWARARLTGIEGPHLDLGCGDGELAAMLPDRQVVSADPSAERLVRARARQTDVVRIGARDPLPFKSGAFASVSMLDVLEHTWDEQSALLEVRRVLRPGGTLVITVPRRHALSFLDPDEAKLRHPRLHRAVYQARFGHDRYVRRFVDLSDGMRGDLPVERQDHHNYRDEELVRVVTEAGFSVYELDAANLWWRAFDVPRLLLPERFGRLTDKPLAWDGRVFHQANLFLAATRS